MATLDEIRLQQLLSPFQNQNIGITNTTAATPFINTADILNRYNVPGLRSQDLQDNLVQQIVEQNRQKVVSDFINAPQDYYPSDFGFVNAPQDYYLTDTGGITNVDLPYSGVGSMRYETPRTIADQNRVLGQTFTEPKKSNGIFDLLMSVVMPGYNFVKNIAKGGQPYQQFSPGTTIRNGIVNVDGVNTPYSMFGGDFYNPNTGLNRFDRAAQRYAKTGSTADLFASSRTGTEFFRKLREQKAAKQKALEDAAKAKRNITTYTGGSNDREPMSAPTNTFTGGKVVTTGGVPGGKYGSPR